MDWIEKEIWRRLLIPPGIVKEVRPAEKPKG